MKKEKIKTVRNALLEAHLLISNECEAVCDDELLEEYQRVMKKLEEALALIEDHD